MAAGEAAAAVANFRSPLYRILKQSRLILRPRTAVPETQPRPAPPNLGLRSEEPAPPLVGRQRSEPSRACVSSSLLSPRRDAAAEAHPSTHRPACSGPPSRRPAPWMGCAASSDRVERRRRGRELGYSEASTEGLLVVPRDREPRVWRRRRGCKVAPEPKDQEEQEVEPAMPGSPSFRYYCQSAHAVVDKLVAEADAADADGSVKITETSQALKTNETSQVPKTNELTATVQDTPTTKIVEASKPKQVTKWLKFRGLAIVTAAWYNLFSRNRGKASTPPSLDQESSKSHRPDPAPALAAAARSHS